MGGIASTCVVRRRKAVRYGSSDLAVEKCVKAVDRGIGAVLEQSAVSRQRERDAVAPSPLGDLAYVTTRGHHDRDKAVPMERSSNPARSTAGRKTARPQERKVGHPAGAVNTRASAVWSTNSERCCSSRHGTPRALVLGSLSKVTRPRNWTAVDVTRIRERSGSMSRLRKPAASASEVRCTRLPGRGRGTDRASGLERTEQPKGIWPSEDGTA